MKLIKDQCPAFPVVRRHLEAIGGDMEALGMWTFIQSLEEGANDFDVTQHFGITQKHYLRVLDRLVDAGLMERDGAEYLEVAP